MMERVSGMPKTTIALDPDLHKRLKHLAVDLGVSFQQLAVRALKEFLDRQAPRQVKKDTQRAE
jgi:predicted transcriptional regulator